MIRQILTLSYELKLKNGTPPALTDLGNSYTIISFSTPFTFKLAGTRQTNKYEGQTDGQARPVIMMNERTKKPYPPQQVQAPPVTSQSCTPSLSTCHRCPTNCRLDMTRAHAATSNISKQHICVKISSNMNI